MKNVLIICLVAIIAICGWLTFNYGRKSASAQSVLDQERYQRMSAEENLENTKTKITSLESEVERSNKKISSLETLLEEAKAANDELKARLKDSEEKNKAMNQSEPAQPEPAAAGAEPAP